MVLLQRAQTLASLTTLIKSLPSNLAATIPLDQLQKLMLQMFSDYIWPQVTARLPFEEKWNRLQRMYEVKRSCERPRQEQRKETTTANMTGEVPPDLADTIIFDTVDRLKNLNHFIAWKDRPVQYNRPRFLSTPLEDNFYNPTSRKVQGANAILDWNNDMQGVRGKHLPLCQHHYLYGLSFVFSDWVFEIESDDSSADFLLVKNIGTTFEPISLRKVWVNAQLPLSQMEKQACPFFFDLQTRGTVMQNVYHPELNPFGFVNLDKLSSPAYLFGPEAKSFTDGLSADAKNIQTQMRPEFSGEALWTFFPFLHVPGTKKMCRYIVQCYANNLFSGGIVPLRIQELYTPKRRLPLYGATHIPDLDSGLYTPSIAEILESHYDELVRAKTQLIVNINWINNPPTDVIAGTPAATNPNVNRPGAIVETSGPADVSRRQPYDAIVQTLQFIESVRDQAQTTGKAVDAILGKAMGGRTTATEASNAFQASMSGVTTDVDNFCAAIYGPYAQRVWENQGKFMPSELRDRICGAVNAPPLAEQDLLIQIGLKTDVGSSFIESIVKQQHLQQAIAASTQSPFLDQAILWKALFRELKLVEALDAVKDNGFEFQVSQAYQQAIDTYEGRPVAIDPSQDHQIAARVKIRFLQDTKSEYNQQKAANPSGKPGLTTTQYLAEQIAIHQQFIVLMQQQQLAMQQAALIDEQRNAAADREHQLALKDKQTGGGNGQRTASNPKSAEPSPAQ